MSRCNSICEVTGFGLYANYKESFHGMGLLQSSDWLPLVPTLLSHGPLILLANGYREESGPSSESNSEVNNAWMNVTSTLFSCVHLAWCLSRGTTFICQIIRCSTKPAVERTLSDPEHAIMCVRILFISNSVTTLKYFNMILTKFRNFKRSITAQ
jgi:hypothetical protein